MLKKGFITDGILGTVLIAFVCLVVPGAETCAEAVQNVYYVDSAGGNDNNTGTSENTAWQSLDKVNAAFFRPGDKILFKANASWTGTLILQSSGTEGSPIMIDMYGTGNKPHISGGGAKTALYLKNRSYWEINNLEITNDAPYNDADRKGILIEGNNAGVIRHIHMTNLLIHHIKGILAVGDDVEAGKNCAGIYITVSNADTAPTRFDDVLIEGCDIYTVDSTGISTNGKLIYPRAEGWDKRKFTNFVIQNNTIHDIGKNAITVRMLDGGVIQNNVVYDTAYRCESGNQIFTRTCYGTVIQNNESYLNRSQLTYDGSGYDADLESPGVIIQYNYSHDNNHGLYWQCTDQKDTGIKVRYNISQGDKGKIFSINYPADGVEIYNNTIYIKSETAPYVIHEGTGKGGTRSYFFKNNLIYNDGGARYLFAEDTYVSRRTIENNLFYGTVSATEPDDPYGVHGDPCLVNPGGAAAGRDICDVYKLQPGSAAIDTGAVIEDHGGFDFFGGTVYRRAPDIGAHKFQPSFADYSLDFYKDSIAETNKIDSLHSGEIIGNAVFDYGYDTFLEDTGSLRLIMAAYGGNKLKGMQMSPTLGEMHDKAVSFYDDFQSPFDSTKYYMGTTGGAADIYGVSEPGNAGNKVFMPKKDTALRKDFVEGANVLVEVMFYDNNDADSRGAVWVAENSRDTGGEIIAYLGTTSSGCDVYNVRIDASKAGDENKIIDTSIKRSQGWRKLTIDLRSGNGVRMYIDGTEVYDGNDIKTLNRVVVGNNNWGNSPTCYFDDLTIRERLSQSLSISGIEMGDTVKWFTWNSLEDMRPFMKPRILYSSEQDGNGN